MHFLPRAGKSSALTVTGRQPRICAGCCRSYAKWPGGCNQSWSRSCRKQTRTDGTIGAIARGDGTEFWRQPRPSSAFSRTTSIREQILGPSGPALAAEGLHPWVWLAAVNLWDDGHYKHAVNGAAARVEEQTQLKLDREDLSGTKLYTEAFRLETKPGERRLRFTHLTELTTSGKQTQTWKSAHQGAMHFGQGCAEGIRNMNAHGTRELPEKEALEYLAALSVLARWVETAQAVNGNREPEPF